MPKRILLVDDSPYILKELSRIMTTHGYEVAATASNGLEAIKKYKECSPDLVIMDIVMPQMGGIQTLILLKKIDPKVVVVMTSSLSGKDKIFECAKAGASHYILKPFEEDKVLEVLAKVLPE